MDKKLRAIVPGGVLDAEWCPTCRAPMLQLDATGSVVDGPCRCEPAALAMARRAERERCIKAIQDDPWDGLGQYADGQEVAVDILKALPDESEQPQPPVK